MITLNEKIILGFTKFIQGKNSINPGPRHLDWTGFTRGDSVDHRHYLKCSYDLSEINLIQK